MPTISVSDFVAMVNQALEYSFDSIMVVGELANFRVSKNRWVYFDLKDAEASVRCFGTVYTLPGPLEDGMLLEISGTPRLHQQFGFSFNVSSIRPVGEGSIRKAAELLAGKLEAEGLFAPERKRVLPYPPQRVGLITSKESAAYADFVKILAARWSGLDITLADVQVQGEPAPGQIVTAVHDFNAMAEPPEVLVLIRGGGSADDLAAFSSEHVVRAVAASRIPTLVAIGHEIDVSLAELAADMRASTPSNAAELLVPDRREVLERVRTVRRQLADDVLEQLAQCRQDCREQLELTGQSVAQLLQNEHQNVRLLQQLAAAYNPAAALARGYAVVRDAQGKVVRHLEQLQPDMVVQLRLQAAQAEARIINVQGVPDGQNL